MGDWLLAVHSGAGRYSSGNEAAYLSVLRSALESTHRFIATANSPPTAPQIAVKLVESFELSTFTNAGEGANLTERGRVECEASVVCGQTHLVSCCGAVRGVKNPSALALKLLEQVEGSDSNAKFAFGRQPPLVVVGEQARHLARGVGLETATEDDQELERYQVTDKAQEHWAKWHRRFQEAVESDETKGEEERLDTVGAICMDPKGNVAAALSSGGVAYKVPGRLGLAGCPRMGCDAANGVSVEKSTSRKRKRRAEKKNAFAVACTGRGEHFIRSNFVGALTRRLEKSTDLERGLRRTFIQSREVNGGVGVEGGVLALVSAHLETSGKDNEDTTGCSMSRTVQLGAAFTTPCMGVGILQCCADVEPQVQVQLLRRPESRQSSGDRVRHDLATHVSFLRLDASSR